ncbi:MAG: hypothetical protein Kow0031_35160 [Anaerolineae bacterium]
MPTPALTPGATLGNGKYKIEGKLGEGGMAQVYLARDVALNRQVAIKVLDTSRAADQRFVARFEREARIAAQLKHANIVSVFEVAKTDGLFYIVMEYLQGKSLEAILREGHAAQRTMEPSFTTLIFQQIANGLMYAYTSKRVVHRDIKPANIMVSPARQVKITDFGIARALEEDSDLTSDNTFIGTPFYMSPEHFKGGTIDHRSDIYSLGIVLYQMVVDNSGPFGPTATTFTALMNKHLNDPPIAPHQIKPDVNPHVEAVILKALEKEPDKRYQTSVEMAQALAAAYSQPVEPAGGKKSGGGLPGWLLPVAAGLAALVLLLVILGAGGYLLVSSMGQPDAAPSATAVAAETLATGETPPPPAEAAAPKSFSAPLMADTSLRAGPGHDYDELAALPAGEELQVESISPDDKWLKVSAGSQSGWVSVASVDMAGLDIIAVPVALVIPPTPSPAADNESDEFTPPAETDSPSAPTATATPTPARPTATATLAATPTPASSGSATRAVVAQPARVVYVQSSGSTHYLAMASSQGDMLNGGLHQFAAAPSWSSDGLRVAFFGEQGISELGGEYSKGNGIWLLDVNASPQSQARQLKADDHIRNLAWSPDGSKIAYETAPPGVSANVVIIDAADGREMARFSGEQPAWSPNGQQLVAKACNPDCGLWLVNADGGIERQLTFHSSDSYPSWSVTGQLAFCTSRDDNWEIYSLNLSTDEMTRVTNRPATDITPVYSREGAEIYLRTDHFGGWRVTALSPTGGNERTIREGVGESNDWGLARPAVY